MKGVPIEPSSLEGSTNRSPRIIGRHVRNIAPTRTEYIEAAREGRLAALLWEHSYIEREARKISVVRDLRHKRLVSEAEESTQGSLPSVQRMAKEALQTEIQLWNAAFTKLFMPCTAVVTKVAREARNKAIGNSTSILAGAVELLESLIAASELPLSQFESLQRLFENALNGNAGKDATAVPASTWKAAIRELASQHQAVKKRREALAKQMFDWQDSNDQEVLHRSKPESLTISQNTGNPIISHSFITSGSTDITTDITTSNLSGSISGNSGYETPSLHSEETNLPIELIQSMAGMTSVPIVAPNHLRGTNTQFKRQTQSTTAEMFNVIPKVEYDFPPSIEHDDPATWSILDNLVESGRLMSHQSSHQEKQRIVKPEEVRDNLIAVAEEKRKQKTKKSSIKKHDSQVGTSSIHVDKELQSHEDGDLLYLLREEFVLEDDSEVEDKNISTSTQPSSKLKTQSVSRVATDKRTVLTTIDPRNNQHAALLHTKVTNTKFSGAITEGGSSEAFDALLSTLAQQVEATEAADEAALRGAYEEALSDLSPEERAKVVEELVYKNTRALRANEELVPWKNPLQNTRRRSTLNNSSRRRSTRHKQSRRTITAVAQEEISTIEDIVEYDAQANEALQLEEAAIIGNIKWTFLVALYIFLDKEGELQLSSAHESNTRVLDTIITDFAEECGSSLVLREKTPLDQWDFEHGRGVVYSHNSAWSIDRLGNLVSNNPNTEDVDNTSDHTVDDDTLTEDMKINKKKRKDILLAMERRMKGTSYSTVASLTRGAQAVRERMRLSMAFVVAAAEDATEEASERVRKLTPPQQPSVTQEESSGIITQEEIFTKRRGRKRFRSVHKHRTPRGRVIRQTVASFSDEATSDTYVPSIASTEKGLYVLDAMGSGGYNVKEQREFLSMLAGSSGAVVRSKAVSHSRAIETLTRLGVAKPPKPQIIPVISIKENPDASELETSSSILSTAQDRPLSNATHESVFIDDSVSLSTCNSAIGLSPTASAEYSLSDYPSAPPTADIDLLVASAAPLAALSRPVSLVFSAADCRLHVLRFGVGGTEVTVVSAALPDVFLGEAYTPNYIAIRSRRPLRCRKYQLTELETSDSTGRIISTRRVWRLVQAAVPAPVMASRLLATLPHAQWRETEAAIGAALISASISKHRPGSQSNANHQRNSTQWRNSYISVPRWGGGADENGVSGGADFMVALKDSFFSSVNVLPIASTDLNSTNAVAREFADALRNISATRSLTGPRIVPRHIILPPPPMKGVDWKALLPSILREKPTSIPPPLTIVQEKTLPSAISAETSVQFMTNNSIVTDFDTKSSWVADGSSFLDMGLADSPSMLSTVSTLSVADNSCVPWQRFVPSVPSVPRSSKSAAVYHASRRAVQRERDTGNDETRCREVHISTLMPIETPPVVPIEPTGTTGKGDFTHVIPVAPFSFDDPIQSKKIPSWKTRKKSTTKRATSVLVPDDSLIAVESDGQVNEWLTRIVGEMNWSQSTVINSSECSISISCDQEHKWQSNVSTSPQTHKSQPLTIRSPTISRKEGIFVSDNTKVGNPSLHQDYSNPIDYNVDSEMFEKNKDERNTKKDLCLGGDLDQLDEEPLLAINTRSILSPIEAKQQTPSAATLRAAELARESERLLLIAKELEATPLIIPPYTFKPHLSAVALLESRPVFQLYFARILRNLGQRVLVYSTHFELRDAIKSCPEVYGAIFCRGVDLISGHSSIDSAIQSLGLPSKGISQLRARFTLPSVEPISEIQLQNSLDKDSLTNEDGLPTEERTSSMPYGSEFPQPIPPHAWHPGGAVYTIAVHDIEGCLMPGSGCAEMEMQLLNELEEAGVQDVIVPPYNEYQFQSVLQMHRRSVESAVEIQRNYWASHQKHKRGMEIATAFSKAKEAAVLADESANIALEESRQLLDIQLKALSNSKTRYSSPRTSSPRGSRFFDNVSPLHGSKPRIMNPDAQSYESSPHMFSPKSPESTNPFF